MSDDTYSVWAYHTIMPATGWRAVFLWPDGKHHEFPVHALALASRGGEHTQRHIVALIYDAAEDAWKVASESPNFCALAEPARTLHEFNASPPCGHWVGELDDPDKETDQ